jgi:2-keto-4-pentenoate hydratase/2-oxohepta-3-ene-1,7-dioic acid hydratase in catechol pathway
MKLLRYQSSGGPMHGALQADGTVRRVSGSIFDGPTLGETVGRIDDLALLPPVDPPTIICVGQNYVKHIEEQGAKAPEFPMLFMKPRTALVSHGADVVYPKIVEKLDYEVELVVVIGRRARHVPRERALEHILGYTVGNDISARDWQSREMAHGFLLWGKGMDTFCPLGTVIETELDPSDLRIGMRVNGESRQDSRTSDLLFDVPHLVSAISAAITLEPGDLIMTGTPSGVGNWSGKLLKVGDVMEAEVEGIGLLRNRVVAEG